MHDLSIRYRSSIWLHTWSFHEIQLMQQAAGMVVLLDTACRAGSIFSSKMDLIPIDIWKTQSNFEPHIEFVRFGQFWDMAAQPSVFDIFAIFKGNIQVFWMYTSALDCTYQAECLNTLPQNCPLTCRQIGTEARPKLSQTVQVCAVLWYHGMLAIFFTICEYDTKFLNSSLENCQLTFCEIGAEVGQIWGHSPWTWTAFRHCSLVSSFVVLILKFYQQCMRSSPQCCPLTCCRTCSKANPKWSNES